MAQRTATDNIIQLRRALCRTIAAVGVVAAWAVVGDLQCVQAGSSHTEREVKAAFVYNFARFVEFPPSTFANADSPIVVGVFGDDQFSDMLDQLVKGKTANGRRLEVKRMTQTRKCDECQLLFVSSSENDHLSRILDEVKNSSILTIGESEGFARRGGVIGFVVDDGKVGFEINAGAAKRHGLKISSKLLSLAKAVMS